MESTSEPGLRAFSYRIPFDRPRSAGGAVAPQNAGRYVAAQHTRVTSADGVAEATAVRAIRAHGRRADAARHSAAHEIELRARVVSAIAAGRHRGTLRGIDAPSPTVRHHGGNHAGRTSRHSRTGYLRGVAAHVEHTLPAHAGRCRLGRTALVLLAFLHQAYGTRRCLAVGRAEATVIDQLAICGGGAFGGGSPRSAGRRDSPGRRGSASRRRSAARHGSAARRCSAEHDASALRPGTSREKSSVGRAGAERSDAACHLPSARTLAGVRHRLASTRDGGRCQHQAHARPAPTTYVSSHRTSLAQIGVERCPDAQRGAQWT